jgi:hypothetical protein
LNLIIKAQLLKNHYYKNKLCFSLKAAGPRSCNGAACASLKKYPSDFFNLALGETEPQEAPNA